LFLAYLQSQETLQSDAVIHLLEKYQPEIQQVQHGEYLPTLRLLWSLRPRGHTQDLLCVDEHNSNTGTDTTTVAMFSREFREWGKPQVSQKDYSEQRDSLSPSSEHPGLQPPPSHLFSEYAEYALPGILAEDPGASNSYMTDRPVSQVMLLHLTSFLCLTT
jgi:hypothetical protein